jgi:hypothetical protein
MPYNRAPLGNKAKVREIYPDAECIEFSYKDKLIYGIYSSTFEKGQTSLGSGRNTKLAWEDAANLLELETA